MGHSTRMMHRHCSANFVYCVFAVGISFASFRIRTVRENKNFSNNPETEFNSHKFTKAYIFQCRAVHYSFVRYIRWSAHAKLFARRATNLITIFGTFPFFPIDMVRMSTMKPSSGATRFCVLHHHRLRWIRNDELLRNNSK